MPNLLSFPHTTTLNTPLGRMLLAATPTGLSGAWFWGQKHFPQPLAAATVQNTSNPSAAAEHLQQAATQIQAYLAGQRTHFDMPLDLSAGTPFQQQVWAWLQTVPHGQTRSYQQGAAALNRPQSARAIGMAVGRNPISIIVPCHRVVGASGALTGFAGGLEKKRFLLKLEGHLAHDAPL